RMLTRLTLCPDRRHRLGALAQGLPQLPDRPAPPAALAGPGLLPHRLATARRTLRPAARHPLGSGPPRRLQEAVNKGGEATGPSPVDRRKGGTAIHIASDAYGLPLGAVLSGAHANDGVQTQAVLEALVVQPPAAEVPVSQPDARDLPRSRADGAYGNRPTQGRANAAGFRMEAAKRGKARPPGGGRIRCAVERCHAFLSQFGRIARRFDRTVRRYLGWVQLAACVILIRHDANGFVR